MYFIKKTVTISASCITIGGKEVGKRCKFPFKYNGVSYNKCTDVKSPGQFWCSTQTHEVTKQHIYNKYGYCADGCPGLENKGKVYFQI